MLPEFRDRYELKLIEVRKEDGAQRNVDGVEIVDLLNDERSELESLFADAEAVVVSSHIFYGVSNNARTFCSTTNARRVIGYQPQDDSEVRFAEGIAKLLK